MKEGDIVRHKLSGERLKITKVHEGVVAGIWIDSLPEVPPWKNGCKEKEPLKGICLIENIEVI